MGVYTTYTTWLPNTTTAQSYLIFGLTSTVVATATIQSLETRGEGIIHGYLAKRYRVPLTNTVQTIPQIIEDIVTFDIYRLLANADGGLQQINSDFVQQNYDRSLAIVKDISDGKAHLFDSAGTLISERSVDDKFFASAENYQPTFDLDSDLNWAISGRRLDDIATNRLREG